MFNTYIIALIAFASLTLFPKSSLASCCYSFSCAPIPQSSPLYISGYNAFSVSLTVSSQSAVNSPGEAYLASVTFPSNYVISKIPTGCASSSVSSVSCSSLGKSQLMANFEDVYILGGTASSTPKFESVVVNGEQCVCQSSCPIFTSSLSLSTSIPTSTPLSKSTSISKSTASTATFSTLTITTTSAASETTAFSSCPTSSKRSTPAPTTTLAGKSSSKPNTGLIVGLTLTMILLVLLTAIYCFLRRRKQGLPFFFGVNLKGSKISLGRGGSDSGSQGVGIGQRAYDIGNVESGYGHAVVGVVPAEKSYEGETQNSAQGPASTQTAEAVAQDQMSTGEPVDTTSRGVTAAAAAAAAAVASTAAEAESRSRTDPESTVIDIPEMSESLRFSGNTQDDTVHSNNAASGANDQQQTPADSLAAKSIESAPLIGAVESKHSRLYRAASGNLLLQSIRPPPHLTRDPGQSHQHRRARSSDSLPSGLLCNTFLFGSDSKTKTPSTPNRGVITTIRPEHHQQQIQQLQFEQDLEDENQRNQLSPQEQAYLSFSKQSGIGLVSSKDAFINPGPPPLPPLSRARSNRDSKKGYTQPIHIRAQRDGASSSTAQEHAAKSEAHNPGLYGYM